MKCICCGREITSEESVGRLIGSECWARMREKREHGGQAAAVSLTDAAVNIEGFVARVSEFLEPEAAAGLKARADEVIQRIRRFPSAVLQKTVWAKASDLTKTVSAQAEAAIEALGRYAGELTAGETGDWRTHADPWEKLCTAMDYACGYRLVAGGAPLRLAKAFRSRRPVSSAKRISGRVQLALAGLPLYLGGETPSAVEDPDAKEVEIGHPVPA